MVKETANIKWWMGVKLRTLSEAPLHGGSP